MNKQLSPKAIFIDLDGTAYDKMKKGHHTMSSKNINAIKKINKRIPVIISTGRHAKDAFPWMQKLNLKYAVCQNGALIIDSKNKLVEKNELSKKLGDQLLLFGQENNLMIKPNATGIFFGAKFPYNLITKYIFKFKVHKEYDFKSNGAYTKLAFAGATKKKISKYKQLLDKKFGKQLSIVTSGNGFTIEVTSSKATKGLANSSVARLLKVNPSECVHIGDSMNDSTTAKFMNLIAMKNSNPKLIQQANFIGPHYKLGGLAKLLNGEFKKIKD